MDAGFGHIADVAAPDAQGPGTMPLHAFPSSNNLRQEGSMLSGMEDDRRTMLIWERAGSGVRIVQILAIDLMRYSYVCPLVEHLQFEDLLLSKQKYFDVPIVFAS